MILFLSMPDHSHLSVRESKQETSQYQKHAANFDWCSLLCSVPRKHWNNTYVTMFKHAWSWLLIHQRMWQDNISIRNTQQLMLSVLFGVLFQEQINVKVKDLSSHVQAFVNPVKHLSMVQISLLIPKRNTTIIKIW